MTQYFYHSLLQNLLQVLIFPLTFLPCAFQAKDFDPESLRSTLPKAVSLLEWAIEERKGRIYVHCTAGLGRAPATAIAYMCWFSGLDVSAHLYQANDVSEFIAFSI